VRRSASRACLPRTDLPARSRRLAELRAHLASPDSEERAYWMGALLHEANTRDVGPFTTDAEIRAWPRLGRYLDRARSMWACLLGLAEPPWPPVGADDA